jgi:hypothetical protein
MGKFLDFITGGNPKVCANMIADRYFAKGDYWKTVWSYRDDAMMRGQTMRLLQYGDLLQGWAMPNLTVLCAIDLNVFAGPANTSLVETLSFVKDDVEKQLRKRGIPEKLISGDNSE